MPPIVMGVAAVCVAHANAISVPIPRRSSLVNIANVRTLAVSAIRICYALARIMAPVSAIDVCVNLAGRATTVTAKRPRILACHQMVGRFARATAPASAESANASPPMMAATLANTVTSVPLARDVVMSSRIACSAKCITRAS